MRQTRNPRIRLITSEARIKTIANRWKRNYFSKQLLAWWNPEVRKTYNKLISLEKTPSLDEIESIVGNQSFTRWTCHICNKRSTCAIEICPDDSPNTSICDDCFIRMQDVFEGFDNGIDN